MLKTIFQFKATNPLRRIMTFLLATLLMTTGLQLATRANTDQLLFHVDALKDPGSLAVKFQDTRAAVSNFIVAQLSDETQKLLSEYDGASPPSPALQNALLANLNQLLQAGPLYDAQSFTKIQLSEQTQELLARNPQRGEALVRLNRLLLADAYPHELASPSEKQTPDDAKGLETCRENLRQIKHALENYRVSDENAAPQWLSELSPQYLDKKVLLCPADPTAGTPGVLTEGAADPTLPCSYLYEVRPSEKIGQTFLLEVEGDMLPIVRCQHHLLNLSVSRKLYRNGPQRTIYNNSTVKIVKSVPLQTKSSAGFPPEVRTQMEEELLKNSNSGSSTTILQINPSDNLRAKLKEQFGEAFLESPEGKALLQQLAPTSATESNRKEFAKLLGKPMPDIALTNLSGEPVTLENLRGKLVLVNLFSVEAPSCGLKLQRLGPLLKTYDAAQLQAVGISTGDSKKSIAAFKEKYQLSMPVWIDKNDQIQTLLNRDASKLQTELITLLLNPERVVKDVFIDLDPEHLSQKVKPFIESKD